MDSELQKDLIEFFDWVEQWYYTPESLAKIEAMKARVVAQQSGQGEDDYSCPRCEGDLNEFRYCAVCGYPYPSPRPPLTPTKN